jgi:hypothetical protein
LLCACARRAPPSISAATPAATPKARIALILPSRRRSIVRAMCVIFDSGN